MTSTAFDTDPATILGVLTDEEGTLEVCIDGVVLRSVEDVRALLPLARPDQHSVVLVTGLFTRALGKPEKCAEELCWERVPSVRHKLAALLESHTVYYEPCSVWNGVRPVYTLKPFVRHVFDGATFSDLRVIRVRRSTPDSSDPLPRADFEPELELGVAKALLRTASTEVVGIANVVLEDFGRSGVAVCTHARDDKGIIPAWFKHPVPNKLVCMPTLYPWAREKIPVLHVGRPAHGLVRVLGTLLQPWAARWYASCHTKVCVFNGYPLFAGERGGPAGDDTTCFLFGYDGGEDMNKTGTCASRDCPIDPDQILHVFTYG
jgi:hypothetical protein